MHTPSTTILISKRLDCVNAPVFKRLLAARIRKGQHTLLIDLTHTDYLGIPGLRMLLEMQAYARSNGGELILTGLQPVVEQVFSRTNALKTFSHHPSPLDGAGSTLFHY
jgi:anti-anti-sigma factor